MKLRNVLIIIFVVVLLALAVILFLSFLKSLFSSTANDASIAIEQINTEQLVKDLDTPWAIDFLPDGTIIFTERPGIISTFNGADGKVVVGKMGVNEESESGLLGIAVDPEFEKNNYIYVYYTHKKMNRVSRFLLDTKEQVLRNELVLLDNIPSARFHDGGRLKFGPDGKLYITTGDATTPSSAQDIDSLAGKILRMSKDGTVPEDNPFGNYVYSYGHRNPQGLAWHPETNELYASEHGPDRNDEINIIRPGQNYGWPNVECDVISEDYENPIRCYSEFTLAPSGIAFDDNGVLYVAGLRGAQLRRIEINNSKVIYETEKLSNFGRMRDVVFHDGYLYITTSNRDGRGVPRLNDDKIMKVELTSSMAPKTLLK